MQAPFRIPTHTSVVAGMLLAGVGSLGGLWSRATAHPATLVGAPQEDQSGLSGLLRAARGISPVACALMDRALANRWGAESIRPVVRRGDETSEQTDSIVRWSWSNRHDPALVEPLSRALRDPDPCVRQISARLFGRLDDETVVPTLVRILDGNDDARTSEAAARALGYTESADAIRPLQNALQSEFAAIRRTAVWALGAIERPEIASVLAVALHDDDAHVRANAAWALGKIENRASVMALTGLLEDGAGVVRLNATWALGEIEDAAAIPALVEVLRRDPDYKVRRTAAWALGRID